jgi:hypothetical protein
MVASQIATNEAVREAQIIGAETRLAAIDGGMMGGRRMGMGGLGMTGGIL